METADEGRSRSRFSAAQLAQLSIDEPGATAQSGKGTKSSPGGRTLVARVFKPWMVLLNCVLARQGERAPCDTQRTGFVSMIIVRPPGEDLAGALVHGLKSPGNAHVPSGQRLKRDAEAARTRPALTVWAGTDTLSR